MGQNVIYLKTMNWIKKFWIAITCTLPFAASAAAPFVVGAIAGVGVIAGFSIYRTAAPVNMADAMNFFHMLDMPNVFRCYGGDVKFAAGGV